MTGRAVRLNRSVHGVETSVGVLVYLSGCLSDKS